jgi:hypothetical protein
MFHELNIEVAPMVSCVEDFTRDGEDLTDPERIEIYEMLFRDFTFLLMAHIRGNDRNLQGKLGAYVMKQVPKITQLDQDSKEDLLTDEVTLSTLSSLRILLTSNGHAMEIITLYQDFLANADF